METLKYLWDILTASSSDPKKWSAFVLGFGTLWIPKILSTLTIVCALGVACAAVDEQWLKDLFAFAAMATEYTLYAVGGIMMLIGGFRKLYYGRWSHPTAGLV